ncbi:MAG: hypothetical protein ACR2H2_15255 [Solirubrobacteraceae bacterium]
MTAWQRTLLAAAVVILCGTVVGALAGGPADHGVTTVTHVVTRPSTVPQSPSTPPETATDPGGIAITPPAAGDAPDTLKELYDSDRVEGTDADFGIVAIAEKTYEGASMYVDRDGGRGTPQVVINTKGRYKRIKGVVGISDSAECAENDANVSITNGNGDRLWGPERVGINSPKRFDISIRNRARVTLDQLSLASGDNPCDGDTFAYPAWGEVEFVK